MNIHIVVKGRKKTFLKVHKNAEAMQFMNIDGSAQLLR